MRTVAGMMGGNKKAMYLYLHLHLHLYLYLCLHLYLFLYLRGNEDSRRRGGLEEEGRDQHILLSLSPPS